MFSIGDHDDPKAWRFSIVSLYAWLTQTANEICESLHSKAIQTTKT